jgi:hypothetical protein
MKMPMIIDFSRMMIIRIIVLMLTLIKVIVKRIRITREAKVIQIRKRKIKS